MNFKSATTWRRLVLAIFVVGVLVWFTGWGLPQVCSQQLPDGSATPVKVCEAMSATDPRALLFLLVVGALVLPDLAELEVGGVLKVRRQLDDVKGEASELKNELAHVRTQVMTAAAAAASSHSKASVETYNVYPGRRADVGSALVEVAGAGDGDFDDGEELGAYAAIAFESGFYGLPRYLSDEMTPAAVAGYVFDDDELTLYSVATRGGEAADALEQAQRSATAPNLTGVFFELGSHFYEVTAPACDDRGLVVGAIAVRMPATAGTLDDDDDQDTVGTVELMANTYARLLIDVMGEKPREVPAGKTGLEGTQ